MSANAQSHRVTPGSGYTVSTVHCPWFEQREFISDSDSDEDN